MADGTKDQEEQTKVAIELAIKSMRDTWPLQLDMIKLKAEIAFGRYTQLKKAGFTEAQALELCTKEVQL